MSAPEFYRYDGSVQTPTGNAVPGASIAVLTQPASFASQPGSPLGSIYSGPNSNSATISAAVWAGQQIAFTFSTTPPSDVIAGSYIRVSGATPSGFNGIWLVVGVVGNVVSVLALNSPGTYVSGGTVATSALPNPTFSDGNGNYFFYAAAGIYSVQIYSPTINERDYPDQDVGVVASGAGSVTSVGLTMPGIFSVAGSPISSSGSFTVTLGTQAANTVFAGPTSGSSATPTFRPLVAADIPSLGSVTSVALSVSVPAFLTESVSGSPVTTSGTLAATIGLATQSANRFFAGPASGSVSTPTFRALVVNDFNGGIGASSSTFWRGDGTWVAVSGSGSVTSVGLSLPGIFIVSGSPVTSTGILSAALATQSAGTVWAGPATGAAAGPTFRALAATDIPQPTILSKSSNYNLAIGDGTVQFTAAATGTLPDATICTGEIFTVINTGASGATTIATTSAQTINGGSGWSLPNQWQYGRFQSNGSNWIVIGNN